MIELQCPDCGSILIITEMREYYCDECERVLSEREIRERCAL